MYKRPKILYKNMFVIIFQIWKEYCKYIIFLATPYDWKILHHSDTAFVHELYGAKMISKQKGKVESWNHESLLFICREYKNQVYYVLGHYYLL